MDLPSYHQAKRDPEHWLEFFDNRCYGCREKVYFKHRKPGTGSGQVYEWHHAPHPTRNGGKTVVPLCLTCHYKIDRSFEQLVDDPDMLAALFNTEATDLRLMMLKVVQYMSDAAHRTRRRKQATSTAVTQDA